MQFKIAGDRNAYHVPAGEQYAIRYIMQYDKDGHKHLIENGKRDLQEIIQKDLESTKIQNIIARCVNPEELHMLQKSTVDITRMPTTMMEANNLMIAARAEFDALPLEIKRYYGNSAERYIADRSQDNKIWAQVIADRNKEQQPEQPAQTTNDTTKGAETE